MCVANLVKKLENFLKLRHDQRRCQRFRKPANERHLRIRTTTQRPFDDDGFDDDGETEYEDEDIPFDTNPMGRDLIDVASNAVSQCPVENGVIRTTWGAVAAGPLIAGILFFKYY